MNEASCIYVYNALKLNFVEKKRENQAMLAQLHISNFWGENKPNFQQRRFC